MFKFLLFFVAASFLVHSGDVAAACIATSDGEICDTRAEAEANQLAGAGGQGLGAPTIKYQASGDNVYSGAGVNYGRIFTGRVDCMPEGYPDAGCTGGAYGWGYWWKGATNEQCENRNNDPNTAPGERLCAGLECGSSRCVAGCTLDISGDPTRSFPGRVQGQPITFYGFPQAYTGETCDGTDPNPDAELTPLADDPDGDKCNADLGVCVTPEGDTKYCIFNPDGTPSTCVPAVDYDNDGTPDEDDPYPGDPTDGADDGEGDEKDNKASGGGTCKTQPSCTGDGIACAILYQTWKTRCAVEAQGEGSGSPGGTGDETGTYNPSTAANQGDDLHPEMDSSVEYADGADLLDDLDSSGFGLSRSCPATSWPTLDFAFGSVPMPWDVFCNWLSILAAVILLVGYLHAGYIVLRATGG